MQQAIAIPKPSVVFIRTTYTGYLKGATFNSPTHGSIDVDHELSLIAGDPGGPVSIASPDGNVVSAGHCVDDQEGKELIKKQAIIELLGAGLNPAEAEPMFDHAIRDWTVEGRAQGSALHSTPRQSGSTRPPDPYSEPGHSPLTQQALPRYREPEQPDPGTRVCRPTTISPRPGAG